MTEDPLIRIISDALSEAAGESRATSVSTELIAPRDGVARLSNNFVTFINDVLVTRDTPFKKGDRLRSEFKS